LHFALKQIAGVMIL